jgi:ferritin-like metal-binding protein YciE
MAENSTDVVKRYLEDAIAAEKSFETHLQGMAKEGDDAAAKTVFHQHALETKGHYERLTARLEALGGNTSTAKSILAHLFGMNSKPAQVGHGREERTTENLTIAFAVSNSEIAMFESLIAIAEAAGDTDTATLARQIQNEERATAEKVWNLIPNAAMRAFHRVDGGAEGATSTRIANV